MTKTEVTKKVVKYIVGISTGWTVGNIITNNTSPQKRRQKAEVFVGSTVIGAMVADQAEDYTDRKIDEFLAYFKPLKDTNK